MCDMSPDENEHYANKRLGVDGPGILYVLIHVAFGAVLLAMSGIAFWWMIRFLAEYPRMLP